jgi:hypothetical protein
MILDVGGGRASERANASPELASSISPSNGQQYRYGQKFLDYIAKNFGLLDIMQWCPSPMLYEPFAWVG